MDFVNAFTYFFPHVLDMTVPAPYNHIRDSAENCWVIVLTGLSGKARFVRTMGGQQLVRLWQIVLTAALP